METQKNNKDLLGVIIYVKSGDIGRVKEGFNIDSWYTDVPSTFVHGGWVQVVVSYEYFNKIQELKNQLNLFSNDLTL